MRPKPLVGVNAAYRAATKDTPAFSYLHAGYYDSLIKSGAVPVVIPPLADEADIDRVLKLLDAIVLIGGGDLDPRRDGFMMHPRVRTFDRRREDFDRKLVRTIADRRMPVFGIGVGMQLLNVTMGGNLFLHIPEDSPSRPVSGSIAVTRTLPAGTKSNENVPSASGWFEVTVEPRSRPVP